MSTSYWLMIGMASLWMGTIAWIRWITPWLEDRRIERLERNICPKTHGSHNWQKVGMGAESGIWLRCRDCGKARF